MKTKLFVDRGQHAVSTRTLIATLWMSMGLFPAVPAKVNAGVRKNKLPDGVVNEPVRNAGNIEA